jgi:hypothetical protein
MSRTEGLAQQMPKVGGLFGTRLRLPLLCNYEICPVTRCFMDQRFIVSPFVVSEVEDIMLL